MKHHIVSLILIIIVNWGFAQPTSDPKSDSLWNIWESELYPDSDRVQALINYTENGYLYSKPDSAYLLATIALQFSEDRNLAVKKANAMTLQGSSLAVSKKYDEAIATFKKALILRSKTGDQQKISDTYQSIGMVFNSMRNLDSLMLYFSKSVRLKKELKDYKGITTIYSELGRFHAEHGNYVKAKAYYTQAKKIAKHIDHLSAYANIIHAEAITNAYTGNYPMALKKFKESLEIKKRLNNVEGVANSTNALGAIYYFLGDYENSMKYYKKAEKLFKELNKKTGMANALNGIGSSYNDMGNYQMAIIYFTRCLKIYEDVNDLDGQAIALQNIGGIYVAQKNYKKALDCTHKSLELRKKLNDKRGIAMILDRIGTVHNKMNHIDTAMQYYTSSLKINQEIGNQNGIAENLSSIGSIYSQKGYLTKALIEYKEALHIVKQIGNKDYESSLLNNIGNIKFRQKDYGAAIDYSSRSYAIASQLNAAETIKKSSKSLWDAYKATGNYKKALEMHEIFQKTKDSIESEDNQKEVIRQEYKYEYEKQAALDSVEYTKEQKLAEATIAQQKAESREKDAEIEVKRNQQYALFGGLGLLFIFGGFMYNRFHITRQQKKIIEQQKEEVDLQKYEAEKQRDLAKQEHHEAEKQRHIVEEKNTEILDSIQYAKRLQDAILPPVKLVKEYFEESFILFRPKDIVSGDFYWMETKDNLIMFAAADCTGHGVPGAMVSVVCANALNKSVNELGKTDPADILNITRELVIDTFSKSGDDVKDGMDISLCVLNEGTQTLLWAGANNPLWIVRRDQNEVEAIKADKQPIGMYGDSQPFTSHSVTINGGDSIYLFSDGYADQFGGERGKKMKSGKFKKLLLEHRHQNMEQQKQALEQAFEDWKGDLEQIDDVCVIGVQMTEKENNPFTRREMEIIQLLEQGNSSKMIADTLVISKATVDTHRRKILKKAAAGNVTELLKICKQKKWI